MWTYDEYSMIYLYLTIRNIIQILKTLVTFYTTEDLINCVAGLKLIWKMTEGKTQKTSMIHYPLMESVKIDVLY